MNPERTSALHRVSTALVGRIRYRHGLPFIISVVLAVVTTGLFQPSMAVSIWTFALVALISTAFALFCGGRFRTFFVAIAVALPFLYILGWFLRMRSVLYLPGQAVGEYFLYFVAAPILLVWLVATLLNRRERHA
jgi:hypothetical protein